VEQPVRNAAAKMPQMEETDFIVASGSGSQRWPTLSAATPGRGCPHCNETAHRRWLARFVGRHRIFRVTLVLTAVTLLAADAAGQ
jgi:hypothetical protein